MKKLIALIIAIITLIGMNSANPSKLAETPVIEPTSTVIETVKEEPPETEEPQAEPSMAVTEESKTEPAEIEPIITEPKQETKPRIDKPKEQKKKTPPAETEKVENDGIVIGVPTPTQTYSCGTAEHHCTGPETHSYICELEQKGCEYCGFNSCPSFYAVDEWGQGCYTPSKCPKYDIHADPVWYCQTCHKPCGDGRNGTCVQFVIDCTCPNCGEQVKRGLAIIVNTVITPERHKTAHKAKAIIFTDNLFMDVNLLILCLDFCHAQRCFADDLIEQHEHCRQEKDDEKHTDHGTPCHQQQRIAGTSIGKLKGYGTALTTGFNSLSGLWFLRQHFFDMIDIIQAS